MNEEDYIDKKDFGVYDFMVNLYTHQTIRKMWMQKGDILPCAYLYEFPTYHFKTARISLLSKMSLMRHKDVKRISFGKISKLKLKNGVTGKFACVRQYFEMTSSHFQPGMCYYACEDVVEQCRKRNKDFEFLIIRLAGSNNQTHAVIKTRLDGFDNPVIIDAAYSLVVEEQLFFELYKTQILKSYTDEELGDFCVMYNDKLQAQELRLYKK